jgi:hypothetical protein
MNPQQQTQVLENLQDIKDLSHDLIYMNINDVDEVSRIANEIRMKAALSIELIYNVQNVQLIKPQYEFKSPYSY